MTPTKKALSGESIRALCAKTDKMLAAHKRKRGEPPAMSQEHHELFLRNLRRIRSK